MAMTLVPFFLPIAAPGQEAGLGRVVHGLPRGTDISLACHPPSSQTTLASGWAFRKS